VADKTLEPPRSGSGSRMILTSRLDYALDWAGDFKSGNRLSNAAFMNFRWPIIVDSSLRRL
jgi:hypothetical protein